MSLLAHLFRNLDNQKHYTHFAGGYCFQAKAKGPTKGTLAACCLCLRKLIAIAGGCGVSGQAQEWKEVN
jgi:hypothetical protein